MSLFIAKEGLKGFDCNATITRDVAAKFLGRGYTFAVRYVHRTERHVFDLTPAEVGDIVAAGLGLAVVQHVAPENWQPSGAKGAVYGATAAQQALLVNYPRGGDLWCDLEGVLEGSDPRDVVSFCNEWHRAVSAGGYLPGLYVGWHCGLSAEELYRALRFTKYWGAYNVDTVPAFRGFQMHQREMTHDDRVDGVPFQFDVNYTTRDGFGDCPTLFAADTFTHGEVCV